MKLKVKFYDARGVFIESFIAELSEVLERIAAFVEFHGTDPEEDGRGADSGRITFAPVVA